MEIIIITVAILILASGGLFYKYKEPDAVASVIPSVTDEDNSFTSRITDALARLLGDKEEETGEKFKEWWGGLSLAQRKQLYHRLPEQLGELTNWLALLDVEEAKIFADQVRTFSESQNFELSWLLNEELNNEPELKEAFEEAVTLYSLAYFRVLQVEEELRLFITFRAWQENFSAKGSQELTQDLFAALVEKGLAAPAPTKLFLAENKRRQKHAESAIRQAADKDKKAFYAILKEVMAFKTEEPKDE